MPQHLAPMLASAGRLPHDDEEWAYEVKWDGVRALFYWRANQMRVESRNGKEIGHRYPELRGLGRQLGAHEAVVDGEIVAFDAHGLPSFERLAKRMHLSSDAAIRRAAHELSATYVIFDLLYLDGRSTTELPYRRRRQLLEALALGGPAWQVPATRVGGGRDLLDATCRRGLEGVIAKRLDSPYRPGERGGEWLKIKNVHRQELVIGGWLPGKDGRAGRLGALLMGYHERPDGGHGLRESGHALCQSGDALRDGGDALRYAGRVGTGFDDAELRRLGRELAARARRGSPFAKHGIQPPRESRFVVPELVAEIEFSGWTRDRILRHSVYRGLRDDKPASEVVLEVGSGAEAGGGPEAGVGPSHVVRQRHQPAPRRVRARAARAYEIVRETKHHTEIEVQGRMLRLSNLDKVLYPATGFTKGQLIDYYAAIAPFMLPHLAGRPVTLKRYPNGVEQQHFFQKRCPAHRPEWVRTAPVWSEREQESIDYCVIDDLSTLIWVANLAAIELHPSLARAPDTDTPTEIVFDLDPGAPAGVRECCRVALWIKEIFDALALRTWVKTSGVKGLQVYLPLNTPVSYAHTKPFARAVAELLCKHHPELVVSRMTKQLRDGKVLIDWSQNDPHKTTVAIYSLRALPQPLISTPLRWEEVERGSRWRRERLLSLQPPALLKRLARDGDPFAEALTVAQTLPELGGVGAQGARG
ncbi:MAG TPA: DNA ligase D [Solirubrobacteraceae bacterium]|nr:DNA ligase D [Solirubrobacteraceae bacterium]